MKKMSPIDVSVLVPVFNEEAGLDSCYRWIIAVLEASPYSFEIVFVDDGSTDGSINRMKEFAAVDPRITVVKLMYNVGQQRAMYAALAYCHGRAVITFDADLQFHPECLPKLAALIAEGYDVVGGIRVDRRDSFFANRFPSWLGRKLINSALKIDKVDFGGVKAYSARMVKMLLGLHTPLVVIPAMAYSISRRVTEIPVRHEPRVTGVSKWSVLSRMEAYIDLYTLYARRPFAWMLLAGLTSLVLSLFLAAGILAYRLLVSENFAGLIIFLDIFLFVTGIYLSSLSLIGEFVVRGLRGNRLDRKQIVEEVLSRHDADSPTPPANDQHPVSA
jgi:undecaprenyl-phosphate 4-deoxy-4-formamido-L-arabinose transferase